MGVGDLVSIIREEASVLRFLGDLQPYGDYMCMKPTLQSPLSYQSMLSQNDYPDEARKDN